LRSGRAGGPPNGSGCWRLGGDVAYLVGLYGELLDLLRRDGSASAPA
jgi:hypothetical protein